MELILIEGLPGSGKSTLAQQLADDLCNEGKDACWFLEEDKEHPVHPIEIKQQKYAADFSELCLEQWQAFIARNIHFKRTYILEGSAFQSCVRFLLEAGREEEIKDYFNSFEQLLSEVKVRFIYLRPDNVSNHMNWLISHRGELWASKVSGYLARSPYCLAKSWGGLEGMKAFWSDYAEVCDQLVTDTLLQVQCPPLYCQQADILMPEECK